MKINYKLLVVFLCAVFCFNVKAVVGEVVQPGSLNAGDWQTDNDRGANAYFYNDGDNFILEVTPGGVAWQGIWLNVVDLDLDVYPHIRVSATNESTAAWNVKLFNADMADQASIFSGGVGGDITEYGVKEVENIGSLMGDQSGVVSFELWLWAIGTNESIILDKLEFYGGTTSVEGVSSKTSFVYSSKKGELSFSGVAGKKISVYSADGRQVTQFAAESNKEAINIKSGIYIVLLGDKAIKAVVL